MRRPSEWALFGVTLATVAGFGRLFTEGFFWQLAAVSLVAHVTAGLCRTRGWGVGRAALVTAAVMVPTLSATFFWAESVLGLPGPEVWGAADTALSDAWALFADVVAPAPPATGFLLATAVALALSAFLADWAAFRLWSPYEALVPTATLFVFGALLGRSGHVAAAAAWLGAAALFLLLHRIERLAGAAWVGDPSRARPSLAGRGAAVAAVAVALGVVVGPALPGADSPPVIDVRGGDGGSSRRVTVSPLVDIRQRLVEQSDAVVFTVKADREAYWRLTSLDIFDGEIWRSGGKYQEASSELPSSDPGTTERTSVTQEYEIEALAALWLPAAFEPRSLEPADEARYQTDSGTLIVETDVDSSDGYRYRVVSEVPQFGIEALRAAPAPSSDVAARYAPRPDGLTPFATQAALPRLASLPTQYDKVRALQDWFQTEFTYDLEGVQAGHSSNAIDAFISARRGYCEQFAGTFAALARELGIPARVAVGFTSGDLQGDTYVVRGRHAHAWPEVWFEGLGWVPFEPTPGRGMPDAQAWTGRTPEQAQPEGSAASTSTVAPTATASTTPPETAPVVPFTDLETAPADGAATTAETDGGPPALLRWIGVLVGLAMVYLLVVPALIGLRRSRRRSRATAPAARVLLAWDDALDAADLRRRPDETYLELATRAGDRFPDLDRDLRVLADRATAADYWEVPAEDATAAEAAAAEVMRTVTDRMGRLERLGRHLDVRRLQRR